MQFVDMKLTEDENKDKQPHQGADHSAPYPVSRMAPAFELVNLAEEISQADTTLATHASGKLRLIANQIKALQDEARQLLEQTQRDQLLHRAQCNFKRQPGKTYHLYQKPNGTNYFSMLSPAEWDGKPPHAFVGSYQLQLDMSWTPVEELTQGNEQTEEILRHLLKK
jgi:hypothetical protein